MDHKVSQLGLHLLNVTSEFIDFFNFPQDIVHLVRKLLSLIGSCIPSSNVLLGNFWSLGSRCSNNRLTLAHVFDCDVNFLNFDQENIIIKLVHFESIVILLQVFYVFLMGILKKLQIVNMLLL